MLEESENHYRDTCRPAPDRPAPAVRQRFQRARFLSTPLDLIDRDTALAMIRAVRGDGRLHYIVTPNSDHVLRCLDESALADIYADAFMSLCDSQIVARLARSKGYPVTSVVTGSDLTAALFRDAFQADERISVIGGDGELIAQLRHTYRLKALAHHAPPMGFIDDPAAVEACCQFVREHPAHYVLLAVGSPQQERLAARLAAMPGSQGVVLCIGASLLFLTGREPRAPRWMSRHGLEWLFRLLHDPRRLWRRYVRNLKIFPLAWRSPRCTDQALTERLEEVR